MISSLHTPRGCSQAAKAVKDFLRHLAAGEGGEGGAAAPLGGPAVPGAAAEPHSAATTAAGADEVVAEANTAAASVDVAALAAAPPSRCALQQRRRHTPFSASATWSTPIQAAFARLHELNSPLILANPRAASSGSNLKLSIGGR